MLFHFLVFPLETPYPIFPLPASIRVLPYPLTHPLPPSYHGIALHWGIEPSQDQGPLLPLMSHKVFLCYTCSWIHGSLHMYSGWWFIPWEL